MTAELPLEAATQDVIERYKRHNNMLASAAAALCRLKERVDAGEANGMQWDEYRSIHLEPYMSRKWINTQLRLAPPGASEDEISGNVDNHRNRNAIANRNLRLRQRDGGNHVISADEAAHLPDPPVLKSARETRIDFVSRWIQEDGDAAVDDIRDILERFGFTFVRV